MELSKKITVDGDAPSSETPKKCTSGDSSDPDVVTREALCQDAVPHFSLDVAGKTAVQSEAAPCNHTGDGGDENRAESEIDQDYKDACDSADVLLQASRPGGLRSPLHESASASFTTSDSGSRSDLGMDASISTMEEKAEAPVPPFAVEGSPVIVTAGRSTG